MKQTSLFHTLIPLLLIGLLLAGGCKMAERTGEDRSRPGMDIDPSRSLVDHLRQFPSLRIFDRGGTYDVQMRGSQSIAQQNRVLFVINRSPIGNSYEDAAALVVMENVERIEALPPSRAQQIYGDRGMFGAVVITTR